MGLAQKLHSERIGINDTLFKVYVTVRNGDERKPIACFLNYETARVWVRFIVKNCDDASENNYEYWERLP